MFTDSVCLFVDMQVQHHINTGQWIRCQSVSLKDGVVLCTLAFDRTYDLTGAYKRDLHIKFANAKTDDDLIAFVREWGPLCLTDEQKRSGTATLPLSSFRVFQRWLRALLDLLNAFKEAEGEHAALQEFIEAECEDERNSAFPALPPYEPIALSSLRHRFGISGDILDWVKGADLKAVRVATDFLVPFARVHPFLVNLTCHRQGKRRYLIAGWTFLSLEEALRWMVWYDEFTKHPLVCCQECRKVFRAESAHARKYCTYKCGHRATARNWQRNKRKASSGQSKQKKHTGRK